MKNIFFSLVSLSLCCFVYAQGDKSAELGIVSCKLDVKVLADKVTFTLIVFNTTDARVVVEFPTSQKYDFLVKDSAGKIVWKYSEGKMFLQVLTAFTLDPNEKNNFEAECDLSAGKYSVQGILPSMPVKIETEWKQFTVGKSQKTKKTLKGKITKILDKTYFLGDDGVAYLVVRMPDTLKDEKNKKIEVTSFQTESIPDSVDKKIFIDNYIE